jgi:hypothetical protein
MLIEYRKSQPPTAKTWFAKLTPNTHQQLQSHLEQLLLDIAESSVQGTKPDQKLWTAAVLADQELWHRAQQHGNQANTMVSIMAGAISKLRSGGDLTAKQLQHIETALTVFSMIRGDQAWQFVEVEQYSSTGNSLQDLRNRLFY